ncbi:MAG: hypothetical protein QOD45_610 [Pseudonocardiales bacterium]|nr:hypothetical protein [Pseudonocardiales bacterium]
MDDKTILDHIHELVAEERALRASHGAERQGLNAVERRRLEHIERELDQAWDLLRQRRARAESGEDPDAATPRSVDEVESYLQ